MKLIRFTIFTSLRTMFVAWFLGYLLYACYKIHLLDFKQVEDFLAIYFWTGLFALITAIIFVPLIVKISNKASCPKIVFPVLTTAAAPIAMYILLFLVTGFKPKEINGHFSAYSSVIGLIFGLLYSHLYSLVENTTSKFLTLACPILFQVFIFQALPFVAPEIAYRYFGDSIRSKAFENILKDIEVGDNIEDIKDRLPGFLDFAFENSGNGYTFGGTESIDYEITYENLKVKTIKVKKRN